MNNIKQIFRKTLPMLRAAPPFVRSIGSLQRVINLNPDTQTSTIRSQISVFTAAIARERRYKHWMKFQEPIIFDKLYSTNNTFNTLLCPRISILLPVYNTPAGLLHKCLVSVRNQTSSNWQLCLVDDASNDGARIRDTIFDVFGDDVRVTYSKRIKQGGIAAATNDALALATGEYAAFLDHDDVLSPHAIFAVTQKINLDKSIDIIYSDEDKINQKGKRHSPTFKPGFSPQGIMSWNYICHFLVVRTDLVKNIGGLRSEYDGAQDYDLILRLISVTSRVAHIPYVLYHWRVHNESTSRPNKSKPLAQHAACRALFQYVNRYNKPEKLDNDYRETKIEAGPVSDSYKPSPALAPHDTVDIIFIDNHAGVIENSKYNPAAIITAVENQQRVNSIKHVTAESSELIPGAISSNLTENQSNAPWLLILDSALQITSPDWLERMLAVAKLPQVGIVGAKIINRRSNQIADAGWLLDAYGNIGRRYANSPANYPGYRWSLFTHANVDAVSRRSMLIPRNLPELRNWLSEYTQSNNNYISHKYWEYNLAHYLYLAGYYTVVAGDVSFTCNDDIKLEENCKPVLSLTEVDHHRHKKSELLNPNLPYIEPATVPWIRGINS